MFAGNITQVQCSLHVYNYSLQSYLLHDKYLPFKAFMHNTTLDLPWGSQATVMSSKQL